MIFALIASSNKEDTPKRKPTTKNITPPGMVRIDKSYLEKYKSAIPRHIQLEYARSYLNNEERKWCYFATQEEHNQIVEIYETNKRKEQALFSCARLNNIGMAHEKAGEIDLAIEVYEENIKLRYPATHSYERLMILYRKRKEYQKELEVINIALQVFNNNQELIDKYNSRKIKTLTLLDKEKTTLDCFDMEAPDRLRIFNDSLELIASTPKISTFILRVGDIDNFFLWCKEQNANGIQIELNKNITELEEETYKNININAIRIAEREYTKWLGVDRATEKKIDKATAKVFETLDELAKCIKPASNEKEAQEQIEHFRSTIEKIYSEL